MKNKNFAKYMLPFILFSTSVNAVDVNSSILREIKLFKLSTDETSAETEEIKTETKREDITENEKLQEILELYFLNEYKSSLYLLNKVEENNDINNFKTVLKILLKLEEGKDVKGELEYLLTFPFVDYFFISEIHKHLIINNKTRETIEFLKQVKVSPFSFIKTLGMTEKEIKALGLEEFLKEGNNTEKEIKLAKAYAKVDMLLDSYETYKKHNANEKYNPEINELRNQINYRIKLYSNYKENTENIKTIIKKFKNVELFKIYKEKK